MFLDGHEYIKKGDKIKEAFFNDFIHGYLNYHDLGFTESHNLPALH